MILARARAKAFGWGRGLRIKRSAFLIFSSCFGAQIWILTNICKALTALNKSSYTRVNNAAFVFYQSQLLMLIAFFGFFPGRSLTKSLLSFVSARTWPCDPSPRIISSEAQASFPRKVPLWELIHLLCGSKAFPFLPSAECCSIKSHCLQGFIV